MSDELKSLLAHVRRRWFAATLLATAGRAAAAAALPLVAVALTGWLLAPSGRLVVLLGFAGALSSVAAALLVLLRMQRRPDDCHVARFVEERASASGFASAACEPDALVSAVEVAETPDRHGPGFAELIVANAVRVLRDIEPTVVISPAAMRRAAMQAIGGVVILLPALVISGPYLLRSAATAWVDLFPGSIDIAVVTGDARVPAGQPLRIVAKLQGRGVHLLSVLPSLVVTANGQQRSVSMTRSDDGFISTFESVDRSFQYKVITGAAVSRSYSVTALFPARIKRIDLRYDYPSFSGLKPRTEQDGGDIFAPEGTHVRMLVHTDKAIAQGQLTLQAGGSVALTAAGDNAVAAEMVLAKDDGYRVQLTDRDGLHSASEVEYFIRLMDDRPPDVRIVRPSSDQGITPLEEVPIEARADDDYGINRFELVYAVAGRQPRVVPFARTTGSDVAKIGTHLLAAEDLRVQPGDVITYYARARDVGRGKRPTETRSDIFFLEVKPFNEEFVSAPSQAMGSGATGDQIDTLIAAQKEIINATWNLERRSAAGRSAADMTTVGQAQTDLRRRLEQMVGGTRRGGRLFPPLQIGSTPQTPRRSNNLDPISNALEAMARAAEQLNSQRTAEAIPHEMAALQGLLQAQAEVRRRLVMQQSASGAGQGGTSRTDRDLSTLFDRELQRQQRTNYETPQQSNENQESRKSDDLLERIRELARRQEELARRQQEAVNAKLSPDEMKRQLERLSREQEELRNQAEQIEKQLRSQTAQASSASRSQGRGSRSESPSGSSSSGDIQRAAEQMRNAASEMRRQNAGGAAASGERAAQSLRQVERQMGGANTDARQRAAGDAQLEAQQIADGQRRIADEVSRLEKDSQSGRQAARGTPSGSDIGNSDALRRLAAEKDRLADRLDRLLQTTRDLGRELPGEAGTPFREAAQQLQGQQVGSRMRSSAEQMRDHASSAGGGRGQHAQGQTQSQVEEQLSRAIDTIVDKLGGRAQADARRVTGELDRTRGMRERLNRLEQQLRDAEAKAAAGRQSASGQTQSARNGQAGGRQTQGKGSGDGGADGQLQRAREEYARELERSRETLGRLQAEQRGGAGATPEQHEYSRSAPGNEAFKQDFSRWETLRKDVDLALEKYEASMSARLTRKNDDDRLSAGGSERVPEPYRPLVSKYFESIAKLKK
jgi:hypothetical protein